MVDNTLLYCVGKHTTKYKSSVRLANIGFSQKVKICKIPQKCYFELVNTSSSYHLQDSNSTYSHRYILNKNDKIYSTTKFYDKMAKNEQKLVLLLLRCTIQNQRMPMGT